MEILITAYQYGDNKHFIGGYKFPKHKDHDIHLPPNTTLVAPPANIPKGKEARWNGTTWDVVNADESHITKEQLVPLVG